MTLPIIVIDTQIFLRATARSTSLPHRIVVQLSDQYTLAVSDEIEAEIVDVLTRPEVRRKFPQITDEMVAATLTIVRAGQRVIPASIPRTSRDPKDDKFLAAAAEANADYLVSEDNDLLTLKTFGGTRIVNALDFLQILTAPPPDDA